MIECWRWFGPEDAISLPEVAQTGAAGIVTALHDIPYGAVWPREAIAARKSLIAAVPGLHWAVVESLPVHEDIKRGEGDLVPLFANYRQSLANLAAEGVRTVCYNFMPLLDWTRTDLAVPLPRGGTALRFSTVRMAFFDVHMLGRERAEADWAPEVLAGARALADRADEGTRDALLAAIMAGLPGAYARYDIAGLRATLDPWAGVTADDLRAALARFLAEVVPTAAELGMRLAIHPDDPPRPLLGLPRIVSTAQDLAAVLAMEDSPASGLTLCTGSLGAHPDNDLPALARAHRDRIHFAHLRNVTREADGSFQEAAHLEGDSDLPAVIAALSGPDAPAIPFRPDHGHVLLEDANRPAHPGYPLIGRLRGLAELRGVIAGLAAGR